MTVFNLRTARLRPGEQYRTSLPVELAALELGGQLYLPQPADPEASLTITRLTSGTLFELAVATRLVGPCVRCLGDAAIDLSVRDRQYQATVGDSEEARTPYVVDDRLEVSQWAHDVVALALPTQILCAAECKGLCAGCGANLNLEACRCTPVEPDPRWSKLAGLKDLL